MSNSFEQMNSSINGNEQHSESNGRNDLSFLSTSDTIMIGITSTDQQNALNETKTIYKNLVSLFILFLSTTNIHTQ